jgi:two-component system KDP operon response regulator KdpE
VARVLVIDDDPALLRALRLALHAAGHEVTAAPNGREGLDQAARAGPEVIVLDLGLPDIDGLDVCRRIRGWSDVPIIVLSATQAEDRKVAALDGGADDYVTKPFGMAELEARLRTALRHRQARHDPPTDTINAGPLKLDLPSRTASLGQTTIELTAKEFDLLAFLVANAGKICTHQMILTAVWGTGYSREAQYLHVYIHRVRQKLGSLGGPSIKTAPGIGYVLSPTSTDPKSGPSQPGPPNG